MPDFIFTHIDQLIDIQVIAISRNHSEADDGLEGIVRDGARGILEYVIEQPEWVPELSDDVIKYSAFVLHTIASQHPFAQANKRTAFVAAENCLLISGLHLVAGHVDLDDFMINVANGTHTIDQVYDWLTVHIGKF